MSTVEEIEKAVQNLSPEQLAAFRGWFAEFDGKHIALTGGCAGACTSMWILLHDDLADPDAEDPVLRESTRVCAAAVSAGQTSIDPKVIQEWLGHECHLLIPDVSKSEKYENASEFLTAKFQGRS